MSHFRHTVVVCASLLAVGLTASCSEDSGPAEPTPAASSATPSTTTTTTESEPPPTDAGIKTAKQSRDAALTVTDIRIGHHEGYDRVVYEFGGKGAPGWSVEYVDKAIQDGSGNDLPVKGTSIMQVLINGSAYPFDSGVTEYAGPDPLSDPSAPAVAEVHLATLFEGTTQSFIGTNAERPAFRVTALANPTRLVIDIAN